MLRADVVQDEEMLTKPVTSVSGGLMGCMDGKEQKAGQRLRGNLFLFPTTC